MKNFAQDLIDAMPTPQARMACVAVLAKYEGRSIYIQASSKSERRRRAARHMLDSKEMTRGDIASALIERFRISERTAWRDIERALMAND